MNFLPLISALTATSSSLFIANPAIARPFVYLDTFTHGQTHKECIAGAKKVLLKNGFANLESFEQLENRESEVSGYHKQESITATIECNQKLGTTSLAVSGLDNKTTYEMYKNLFHAKW